MKISKAVKIKDGYEVYYSDCDMVNVVTKRSDVLALEGELVTLGMYKKKNIKNTKNKKK